MAEVYLDRLNAMNDRELEVVLNQTGRNWQEIAGGDLCPTDAEYLSNGDKSQNVRRYLRAFNPLLCKFPTNLRDVLANCNSDNIRNDMDVTYGRGILVATVAAFMAESGADFAEVWPLVKRYTKNIAQGCVPDGWN